MIEDDKLELFKEKAVKAKTSFPDFHKSTLNDNSYYAFLTAEQLSRYKSLLEEESQDVFELVEEIKALKKENEELKAKVKEPVEIKSWSSDDLVFEIQQEQQNKIFTLYGLTEFPEISFWIGDTGNLTDLLKLIQKVLSSEETP